MEIETIERNGLTATLSYDEDSHGMNPRKESDNVWTILTAERQSIPIDERLPDPDELGYDDCADCDDGENVIVIDGIEFTTTCKTCDGAGDVEFTIESWLKDRYDAWLIVPVFKYEHGLVKYEAAVAGNPFSCEWDSGQVGFAVVSKEKVLEEWPNPLYDSDEDKTLTEIEQAIRYLDGELSTYTSWCNGEIYEFTIERDSDGELLDSCGGIYDRDYAEEEMKDNLTWHINDEAEKAAKEATEREAWAARDVATV